MRINHNISALTAYRHLTSTTRRLSTTLERLSSGFKINKAADDAAGLAISEKLRSQISGLDIAVSNAQDGISLIQTAEGALERTHTILRRIRDLSELAANGDKTDADRAHYQDEINQLLAEIDRIANTTEYNTKKILNGFVGSTATEAGDLDNINVASKVMVSGAVVKQGEYQIKILTPAEQATAIIGGWKNVDVAGGQIVPDVNEVGGLSKFFDATGAGSFDGKYSFKIEMDGKTAIVDLVADINRGDSMSDAIKKINEALADAGIDATAVYDTHYLGDNTRYDLGIRIVANNFGSAHDIEVYSTNIDLVDSTKSVTFQRNLVQSDDDNNDGVSVDNGVFGIYNSDLSWDDGILKSNTVVTGGNIEDLGFSGTFSIRTRENNTYTVDLGALITNTLAGVATEIETQTLGNVTAIYNEDTGTFTLKDNTAGSSTFKVWDNAGGTAAERLGILGEVDGKTIEGVKISKTQDFVLEITDPDSRTARVMASYGNRSTTFSPVDSLSAVVNSGVDPDQFGDEKAGTGGISQIGFTLEEKMMKAGDQFSILAQAGSFTLQIGPNAGKEHRMTIVIGDMGVNALDLASIDISTQEAAQNLIDSGKVDEAIEKVSDQRSSLGAFQNRLNHTIQNLSVTRENLQAAESRIRDVDMAQEMMEFTRNQIMAQAGTAMLGQASVMPQMVLQLLGAI